MNTRAWLTKGRVSLGNACNQRQDVTNEQHFYFHSISIKKNKHFGRYIIVSSGSYKMQYDDTPSSETLTLA